MHAFIMTAYQRPDIMRKVLSVFSACGPCYIHLDKSAGLENELPSLSAIPNVTAESIYRTRKQQRITQAELAEKSGVTEQTIRKIEHGEGNPQLDVFCSLISVLGIDPSEIVYPQKKLSDPARK